MKDKIMLDDNVRLIASVLGRLARGVPKRITESDRERRRKAMREINERKKLGVKGSEKP